MILGIDTSTVVSSVAIASNDKLLAEITIQTRHTHSETLMPHIQQVLNLAGVKKEALDGVAVSIGPGSFTGLRIGLATAKGLAYALQCPLLGCLTLEALAYHFMVPGVLIGTLMDAQKGNAYIAFYAWENGKLAEKLPICVRSMPEILKYAASLQGPVVLTGDLVQKEWKGKDDLPLHIQLAAPHLCMPRAANVALLGLGRLQKGEEDNLMDLEPFYVRRSEAEVLWEARHGKESV